MQQTNRNNAAKKLSHIKQVPKIREYFEEVDFLKKARAEAESLKIPVVDDETGRFLELACYFLKPSKILEIGCGTGYSTYFLLKSILPGLIAGKSGMSSGRTVKSAGGFVKAFTSVIANSKEGNSKIQFSYTGIDLNRQRLSQACFFIGSLINKTIKPCVDGKRIKTVLEYENFCCSFEFIHGNAVKITQEKQEVEEKYDLVFLDAAKYQYPCYIEAVKDKLNIGCAVIADNIFYSGKIFSEETVKHDANSVAGIREYLRIITMEGSFETTLFNIGDGVALSIYNKGK
jgi:predicted O-methyltransferase YrrM